MTNLQHHLRGIRKIIHETVKTTESNIPLDFDNLHHQLRDYLPKSYGIGSGQLTDGYHESEHLPIIVYDIPLSEGQYTNNTTLFDIRHVLVVGDIASSLTNKSLRQSLDRIASVKRQDTGRKRTQSATHNQQVTQVKFRVPSDRLPYAMITFNDFADYPLSDLSLFERIHRIMADVEISLHPDEMQILSQPVHYRNPLTEYDNVESYDTGLTKTPFLSKPRNCYICKREFFRPHYFYDRMCVRCGDSNYNKRKQSGNLYHHRILVTGARVKIGYYTALKLLRAGAEVIVTSRFPVDTAQRYAREDDFLRWHDRLHIYGLDLRQIDKVEVFINLLYERYEYFDAIINNAAQTVKRPPEYYAYLIPIETQRHEALPAPISRLLRGDDEDISHLRPSLHGLLNDGDVDIPQPDAFDNFGQPIDDRDYNSWVMRLDEVPTLELMEVHLVNAIAPALLVGQLKGLLKKSPHQQRFVINVSAAEGRFTQFKMGTHPHTNMAKAAMNMMTRTIADDYAKDRIYVNSIDPGWVSDQIPRTSHESRQLASQLLPIDMEDASARLCDLLFAPANPPHGQLIKDYQIVSW